MLSKKRNTMHVYNHPVCQETVPMTRKDLWYFLSDWEEQKNKMVKEKFVDMIFHGKKFSGI